MSDIAVVLFPLFSMYTGHGQATILIHVKETHDTDRIRFWADIFSLGSLHNLIFLGRQRTKSPLSQISFSYCLKDHRSQFSDKWSERISFATQC